MFDKNHLVSAGAVERSGGESGWRRRGHHQHRCSEQEAPQRYPSQSEHAHCGWRADVSFQTLSKKHTWTFQNLVSCLCRWHWGTKVIPECTATGTWFFLKLVEWVFGTEPKNSFFVISLKIFIFITQMWLQYMKAVTFQWCQLLMMFECFP